MKAKLLSEVDAATAKPGDIIWLKGSSVSSISAFVLALVKRDLDLYYHGPADRYVVASDRIEADTFKR